MDRFFEDLFLGLSSGAIYALVALALVVIFRGTGHLNFAQGEMATLSAFIVWVLQRRGRAAASWPCCSAWPSGSCSARATEVTIIRPVEKKSPLRGVRGDDRAVPRHQLVRRRPLGSPPRGPSRQPVPQRPRRLRGASSARTWRYQAIGVFAVTLVVTAAAVRCCSSRHGSGWPCGASPATPSRPASSASPPAACSPARGASPAPSARSPASMVAGRSGQVTPTMMFTVFVYATAAATLGGLDSPGGAVIGGLPSASIENMAAEFSSRSGSART